MADKGEVGGGKQHHKVEVRAESKPSAEPDHPDAVPFRRLFW